MEGREGREGPEGAPPQGERREGNFFPLFQFGSSERMSRIPLIVLLQDCIPLIVLLQDCKLLHQPHCGGFPLLPLPPLCPIGSYGSPLSRLREVVILCLVCHGSIES